MKRKIRIGSRDSKLAVVQAEIVIRAIQKVHPELELKLVTMKTTGDKILDRRLDQIGGKGLFVKELDQALLDHRIDLSVHSLKDLPMEENPDLPLVGFTKREDPRDCLLYKDCYHNKERIFDDMAKHKIGSSSRRRIIQIQQLYPNAVFESIRGNVQTRLRKLEEQDFCATALAVAGLNRLQMQERIDRIFSVDEVIPAAGQGILAIQARKGEEYSFLDHICDFNAELAAFAERAFTKEVDGGCSAPIAAYAEITGNALKLRAMYYSDIVQKMAKGQKEIVLFGSYKAQIYQAEELGRCLAEQLKQRI